MINISVALLLQISSSNCQDCSSGECLSMMHAKTKVLSHIQRWEMSLVGGAWVAGSGHELQLSAMHNHDNLGVASTEALWHTDHIPVLTRGEGWVGSRKTLSKALVMIGNDIQMKWLDLKQMAVKRPTSLCDAGRVPPHITNERDSWPALSQA